MCFQPQPFSAHILVVIYCPLETNEEKDGPEMKLRRPNKYFSISKGKILTLRHNEWIRISCKNFNGSFYPPMCVFVMDHGISVRTFLLNAWSRNTKTQRFESL